MRGISSETVSVPEKSRTPDPPSVEMQQKRGTSPFYIGKFAGLGHPIFFNALPCLYLPFYSLQRSCDQETLIHVPEHKALRFSGRTVKCLYGPPISVI
jgi:hypothetical protein